MIVQVRARAGGIFVTRRPQLRCCQAGDYRGGFRRETVHLFFKFGNPLCGVRIGQFRQIEWPAVQATCSRCLGKL